MSQPPIVAVDANGADAGPAEVARGAGVAARAGVRVLLFGPVAEIGPVADGVRVINAPVSIAKVADPARAVRTNPEASIVAAWRAVAAGEAQAVVSGGSTGAALAAGLLGVKRARGIHRPALAALVPMPGRPFLLLDAGANVVARPEHLVQFAHMGAAFMRTTMGLTRPRVALLSNGEEPERGREEVIAAHASLARDTSDFLEFVGNVEGFAVGAGRADVIVTDGFTGNVALKLMEGTAAVLLDSVRAAARSSRRSTVGGALLKPALSDLRQALDPQGQGGAVLLGLRAVAVLPHGSFAASGFARAIELAAQAVSDDLLGSTLAQLHAAGALRASPPASAGDVTAEPSEPSEPSEPGSSLPSSHGPV